MWLRLDLLGRNWTEISNIFYINILLLSYSNDVNVCVLATNGIYILLLYAFIAKTYKTDF